jgi:hypothetical protein
MEKVAKRHTDKDHFVGYYWVTDKHRPDWFLVQIWQNSDDENDEYIREFGKKGYYNIDLYQIKTKALVN